MSLWRKRKFEPESEHLKLGNNNHNTLKKSLGAIDLVLLGIGCIVGTGIFVVTGIAAAKYAGPAISISYIIAAMICGFSALAYAELASMVPVSGSAYSYSYIVIGEFVAWLVGFSLILEYGVGAATVASGWSGYITGILYNAGASLPKTITSSFIDGGIINLPAVLISLFIGLLLFRGTKNGILVNRILVATKLGAIFLFILISAPMLNTQYWSDFSPFGINGIIIGAGVVFYAYIGFDAVATTAEECKNPKRDIPIGIIGSLIICTILYVAVSLLLTGISHYSQLNNSEPLARALRENGSNIGSALVATGAIAGMTSVLLALLYGQSRIFFAMSRDGLIPRAFSKVHPKFFTPHISVALTSIMVAILSGTFSLETLSKMTSIGTLFSFIVVAISVILLRIKDPEAKRYFRCPLVYITAPMAIIGCGYLMITLLYQVSLWMLLWFLLGLLFYFTYSYKHSKLSNAT